MRAAVLDDLDATPEAYRAMEANQVFGRIVVEQK